VVCGFQTYPNLTMCWEMFEYVYGQIVLDNSNEKMTNIGEQLTKLSQNNLCHLHVLTVY